MLSLPCPYFSLLFRVHKKYVFVYACRKTNIEEWFILWFIDMSGSQFFLFSLKVLSIKPEALLLVEELLDSPNADLGKRRFLFVLLVLLFRNSLDFLIYILKLLISFVLHSLHLYLCLLNINKLIMPTTILMNLISYFLITSKLSQSICMLKSSKETLDAIKALICSHFEIKLSMWKSQGMVIFLLLIIKQTISKTHSTSLVDC